MTQRQQYAVVPREPTEEMRLAAWLVTNADPVSCDEQMAAVLTIAIEAAPPSPDQVLSGEEVESIYHAWVNDMHSSNIELMRRVERAVLKQLGAKNV